MKEFVYWLMKKMGCTCDKMKKSSYAWEMPDLALLNLITYEELLEDRRRVILEKFARKDEAAGNASLIFKLFLNRNVSIYAFRLQIMILHWYKSG